MSKYIKLDDLQEFCDHQIAHEITPNDFQRMSYLEIVRCKDCKHRGNSTKCVLSAISEEKGFPLFMLDNRGDWFCADGKPKSTIAR